jgi:carbohydrate kinase (thermoresistant glucokinase family)
MVIIVMGVSGAGKTVVGKALAAKLSWTFEDADNFHPQSNIKKMHVGVPLTEDDRQPWLQALNTTIRKWIAEKCDVVLACSALRRSYRDALRHNVQPPDALRFVYLKGTFEEIDRRLRIRAGHFMPESLLQSQFATLEEPDSSEAIPIDIAPPVASIVNSIIAATVQARPKP